MPGWLEGVDPTNRQACCPCVCSLLWFFWGGDVNKSIYFYEGHKPEIKRPILQTIRQRKESSLGLTTVPLVWNQQHVLNKT